MEAVEKKVENQIQFWTLLGPFFVLLSITALLFKVSPHWYFPVSALIGIPLCVRWKMKGMAGALGCLFLLSGINSQSLELTDQYWHVGLSLAMAFSFIVLTLSLEESDGLVSKVQVESQSRLDNFLLLDEKWKSAEAEWTKEREGIEAELSDLTRESAKLLEEKQTFYKLAQLAKDELIQVRGQHELLLQDLLYKKEQIAQLHERLDENEQTIQDFVNSDPEKKIQVLADQITTLEKEKEVLKAQVTLAKEEKVLYQHDKEQFEEEKTAFQVEKMRLVEENKVLNEEREGLQEEKAALKHEKEVLENEKSGALAEREKAEGLAAACKDEREKVEEEKAALKHEKEALENEKSGALAEREKAEGLAAACKDEREKVEEEKAALKYEKETLENEMRGALLEREKAEELAAACKDEREKIEEEKAALKQEREALENEKSGALAEREKAEALAAACKGEREKIEEEKAALKQEREALENEKVAYQLKQNDYEIAHEHTSSKARLLEENLKTLEIEKIESEQLALKVTDELRRMEKKVEEIRVELLEQQASAQQANQEKDKLFQEKLSLEETLRQTREEHEKAKNKIAATSQKSKPTSSTPSSEARAIELMYKQLKKQFQDKSEVLDATRRELFAVNEELLKMRRQSEEESVYCYSKEEKQLQSYVIQLGKQFEQMKANYQQEVDDLMQLISDLLKEK